MNNVYLAEKPEEFDIPAKTHPFTELIYIREGVGEMVIEGQTYRVGPGDIVCIPAGAEHTDRTLSPRINGIVTYSVDDFHDHSLPGVYVLHDRNDTFWTLLEMAVEAQLREGMHMRAYLYSLRQSMMNLVHYWANLPWKVLNNDAVSQVYRAIQNDFSDPDFDLAAEIEKTGYCISHFRRIFKAAYGRPPQQQLNRTRIEYAKLQMRLYHSAYPVKRLSRDAGFKDPYYFSRMFRQLEGCSPSEYLERIEKEA